MGGPLGLVNKGKILALGFEALDFLIKKIDTVKEAEESIVWARLKTKCFI